MQRLFPISSIRFLIPVFGILLLSVDSFAADSSVAEGNNPGPVRLVLPPRIPAIVGQECNLYFDNVVLVVNPANWVFDVDSKVGSQQVGRWTWIPGDADVGDHALTINVRNSSNEIVAGAKTTVRVVSADRNFNQPVSVLCIGDSLTHASVYPQRLLDLSAAPGNPRITLIGTHWSGDPGPNRHEGYGGWTAKRFATHYSETARSGPYHQRGSPFLYQDEAGHRSLDFERYCRDVNQGVFPDVATIFLGPNDIFGFNDNTIEGGIEEMLEHLDLLIGMLRKKNEITKVALMLAVPPAATQDAFGANYGSGQTRWQYKRNQHRLVERMLDRYSNREGERIYLVPTYINLDCEYNYPGISVPANSTSDHKISRLNNGVHPSKSGYDQIGDLLFAWLKGL